MSPSLELREREQASPFQGSALIELQNVERTFGSQVVIQDLDLKIERGETIAVIGESGCGKSVTLKLIVGLLSPSRGNVLFEGRPWHDRNEREMKQARLRFGFLFQGAALFDSMTVRENLAFGLRQNFRYSEHRISEIVEEGLAEVGLSPQVASKKPAELSGGMRKRVGLARALAMQPEIMLYDEPTTGLDPIMTDVINRLIVQARSRRPVTSIVVTHEMSTVRKVADRVVMLYPSSRLQPGESQIIFDGTTIQAFSSFDPRVYQFVHGEAGERMKETEAR